MSTPLFDIDIRGSEETQAFIKAFGSKGMQIVSDELHKITIRLRKDILQSMRNTHRSPGRYYKVGKGIFHKPSAAGFPPAINTGNLANRMYIDYADGYSRLYIDNVIYAKFLEEGTKKMKARPFFGPAIERSNWEKSVKNRIIAERFAGRRLEG